MPCACVQGVCEWLVGGVCVCEEAGVCMLKWPMITGEFYTCGESAVPHMYVYVPYSVALTGPSRSGTRQWALLN